MQLHWFAKSSGKGRVLRPLGVSWAASPVRRVAQAACFVLFFVWFFWTARPRAGALRLDEVSLFLKADPLVSIVAAVAGRVLVTSLWVAGVILAASLVVPRVFCGYICPMGTLIDLFDWAVGKRVHWLRAKSPGAWRNVRYWVLAGVLAAAGGGVVLTGYVAPIPLLTRGVQSVAGGERAWEQLVAAGLVAAVLLLGLLRPRFWCRHVCPSGAIFSILSILRLTDRKVADHCTRCGKCARMCSFDAVNDDFTTIGGNCAFCQTCGGICPVGAVSFGRRSVGGVADPAAFQASPMPATEAGGMVSRRGVLIGAVAGAVGGGLAAAGVRVTRSGQLPPIIRPPGSPAEDQFARLCVRCGECLRACPSGILQASGLSLGIDRLWTPWANADVAGCQANCNNCGQVCPTGAIAALSLEQKRQARMGLAEVDGNTCLAFAGRDDCRTGDGSGLLCYDVCEAAEYAAIVTEGMGETRPMPSVRSDRCVGCGLCQARCFGVNVVEKKLLRKAAIRVRPLAGGQAAQSGGGNVPAPTSAPASTQDVPYSPD